MANIKSKRILKTVSVIALASVFSNAANAWFWDSKDERPMRYTAQGQKVPAVQESWIESASTYHEELKPTYNPRTQRVEVPKNIVKVPGSNTHTSTVKPAWYDKATTYNEEQKRPWNPYDEAEKKIPAYMYYDKKEAKLWNDHYKQKGLEPVPYMYGSASLVLRKERQIADFGLIENTNLDGVLDEKQANPQARMVGMDNVYIKPVGGFASIDNRDAQNQLQAKRSNNIMLSDPVKVDRDVSVYNNVMIGNPRKTDVQAVTKIDKPVADWRDKLDTHMDVSRPGDFDYKDKKKTVQAYAKTAPHPQNYPEVFGGDLDGQVIAGTGIGMPAGQQAYNPYAAGTAKVNDYTVENGDTLSQISDKEKIYGDWTLWPLIYDANRSQVKDPDLIRPGQNLDIPRDYQAEEEVDARYRAKNRNLPISLYDGE